jgi:hypothetical protein
MIAIKGLSKRESKNQPKKDLPLLDPTMPAMTASIV